MKRRLLRAAGWGVMGLLGFAILLVLATNVLFRTNLFRRIVNADPDSLVVDYRGAACWYPGHVTFDSLTLRSRDHNVEFEAVLEDVAIRVSLADLPGRRLHATRVRARRLGFRLRERLTRDEATPARLARYPRIEGFADPPLLQTTPSPSEPGETPWRVVIDDLVVASVEEIWIDAWKWSGEARASGEFELLPGLEGRVGAARLEVARGDLQRGDAPVLKRIVGVVRCELPRFDIRAYSGNEVWKIVSGGSELRGDLAGVAFFSQAFGGPRLSGGAGSIRERVGLTNGVGKVHLSIAARDVTVREGKRTYRGAARIDVEAPKVDFRRGEASLAGSTVVLSNVGVDGGLPARPWAATFSAPTARLVFADGSVDGRLLGQLRDARPIVALMPSGLPKWVAGLLSLEDLHVSGRIAAGPSRLALTSLRLSSGDFSLEGDYRSSPGRRHGDFRAKKGLVSIRFTIPSGG